MELSFTELKELISFGQELGLQQLQTQGLVVIYGSKPSSSLQSAPSTDSEDEMANIIKMYAAAGKEQLRK